MVHNLTDRELWVKQGEEYLRKARSNPPSTRWSPRRRRREKRKAGSSTQSRRLKPAEPFVEIGPIPRKVEKQT